MNSDPLLTVIVFTYNHKKTIRKCIESIACQKTAYPYEIHVWDDASIDGTSDICRQCAAEYPDRIKLTVQPENTFCKSWLELQSYAAIRAIKTKYFSIIDGDDCWCDENKIQTALDFLESHPEYVGWAHDTLQVNEFTGESVSYVHDILKTDVRNPVTFAADAPFFLTSSRIFRTLDYAQKGILPIDYLLYYYHLSQGPVHYHDKIMAVYLIGKSNTYANRNDIPDLASQFAYKLSKLFDFKRDDFCTLYHKRVDDIDGVNPKRHERLLLLKKIFGIRFGWRLWFFFTFVPKYGLECLNVNYVFSHKKAKRDADNRKLALAKRIKKLKKNREKREKHIRFWDKVLSWNFLSEKNKRKILKKQEKRILKQNQEKEILRKMEEDEHE